MTDPLRKAIVESGMAYKALERETSVKRQSLMRFVRGEQSLRLDMADKLIAHFGFKIVPDKRRRKDN